MTTASPLPPWIWGPQAFSTLTGEKSCNMKMTGLLEYTTLLLLGLVVLSALAIADVLKRKGLVKSRFYTMDLSRYIEGTKKAYREGDTNIRFWIKLMLISFAILVPLSILELFSGLLMN